MVSPQNSVTKTRTTGKLHFTAASRQIQTTTRTVTAQNNQTAEKNYGLNALDGEVSDQISGQDFYSTFFSAKCRNGKVPFSFKFSLNLANGKRIDTRTYLFDEVPGTGCLANTGWC